jgi:hypothetical protein
VNLPLADLIAESNFKTISEVFAVLGILHRKTSWAHPAFESKVITYIAWFVMSIGPLASCTFVSEVCKNKVSLIGSVGQISRSSLQ